MSAPGPPAVAWHFRILHFFSHRWWWALAGLGVMIAASGVQSWNEKREPERVVRDFVDAIKWGNQAAALKLLTSQQAASAQQGVADHIAEWVPSPDLQCEIRGIQISLDLAIVKLSLIENGYRLQPEIVLARDRDGAWKIAEINDLQMDPRWLREQRQLQAESDERLASDLESSLKYRPGVLVQRDDAAGSRRQ